jgi:hypothetical protein
MCCVLGTVVDNSKGHIPGLEERNLRIEQKKLPDDAIKYTILGSGNRYFELKYKLKRISCVKYGFGYFTYRYNT